MNESLDLFALALTIISEGVSEAVMGLEEIGTAGEGSAEKVDLLNASFEHMMATLGPLIALFEGFELLKKSIEGTAELQESQDRLRVSVENAGVSFDKVKGQLQELINKFHETSVFSRGELTEALVRMIGLTGEVKTSTEQLGAAVGLATLKHMDLEAASNLVARAINGNATQLNRQLGITGDAANALEVLALRTRGYAQDEMAGLHGQLEIVNRSFSEMLTNLGKQITSGQGWRDIMKDLTFELGELNTWITNNKYTIDQLVLAISGLLEIILMVTNVIATVFIDAFKGGLVVIADVEYGFRAAGDWIVYTVGIILKSFGDMSTGLGDLIQKLIGSSMGTEALQSFGNAATKAGADLVTFGQNAANVAHAEYMETLGKIYGDDQRPATTAKKSSLPDDAGIKSKTKATKEAKDEEDLYEKSIAKQIATSEEALQMDVTSREGIGLMQEAIDELTHRLETDNNLTFPERIRLMKDLKKAQDDLNQAELDAVKVATAARMGISVDALNKMLDDQVRAMRKAKEEIKNIARSLSAEVGNALEQAFTSIFTNSKGANKIAEFGKVILKSLGTLFIDQGKAMITYSNIMIPLAAALHSLFFSGPAAAIAGAALIALGSAFGAAGSGSSSPGGGSGSAGAAASSSTSIYLLGNNYNGPREGWQLSGAGITNITIIGANDSRAQKDLSDLFAAGRSRGLFKT